MDGDREKISKKRNSSTFSMGSEIIMLIRLSGVCLMILSSLLRAASFLLCCWPDRRWWRTCRWIGHTITGHSQWGTPLTPCQYTHMGHTLQTCQHACRGHAFQTCQYAGTGHALQTCQYTHLPLRMHRTHPHADHTKWKIRNSGGLLTMNTEC